MKGFPAYLVEHGWDVHVVSSPGARLDELAAADGISVHPLSMAREPAPVSDLRALADWVRLLRRVRPDVISVGTPKAGLLGGIAGWMTRVPHRVYLLRGLRLETASGVALRIFATLERLTSRMAHVVLSVSPSLRERAIELRLVRADKILVLGHGSSNGVDLGVFAREKPGSASRVTLAQRLDLAPGVPVVGFVGRLTRDKGLQVLQEARSILNRDRVDHQLLVVGGVEDETGSSAFETQGSGRPAIVTGHVPDPETYYQVMDLLCLPTLREGFPNVVLEAGAVGIPTVTTTATGAIDSVVDGVTGLIAEAGSASSLARQLASLLEDSEMRQTMGLEATRYVGENFERAHVWSLTEEFYRDIAMVPRDDPREAV